MKFQSTSVVKILKLLREMPKKKVPDPWLDALKESSYLK
jgi:hypothetical protein